jgi:hypothetical protein
MGGFGRRIGDGVLWVMEGDVYFETEDGTRCEADYILDTERGQYSAAEYVAIEAARMGLRDLDLEIVHAFCSELPSMGYVLGVDLPDDTGGMGAAAPHRDSG